MNEEKKELNMEIEQIAEKVPEYISERKYADLKEILIEMNPADIGDLMEELPNQNLPVVYRLLPKELAAEVFVYIDPDTQEQLIKTFSDSELKEVIDELYVDDTVDLIEEMPASVVKRILKHTDKDMRDEINRILKYPKDSAGSVMTTEYVDLKKNLTVEDAFTRIRRTAVDKETIYTCYVTDENRKLIGLVTVKDLLLADYSEKISDIMETNIIYVNTSDDQEYVANMFTKYDFSTIPVVDAEERLVGIVTFDDAMDVLLDETTEDIEKMAAIPGRKSAAFATGGCLWEDYALLRLKKGPVRFVDEDEAAALVQKHSLTPERDAESAALYCQYEENGQHYELWYADSETINAWIKLAADNGIERISLWRLGGNTDIKAVKNR